MIHKAAPRRRTAGGVRAPRAARRVSASRDPAVRRVVDVDVARLRLLRAIDRLEVAVAGADAREAAVRALDVGLQSATPMTPDVSRAFGEAHDALVLLRGSSERARRRCARALGRPQGA